MSITPTLLADSAPISATRQFFAYGPSHLTVLVVFATLNGFLMVAWTLCMWITA